MRVNSFRDPRLWSGGAFRDSFTSPSAPRSSCSVRASSRSSGQTASVEHLVVELAQIEFRAQLFLSALTELAELELAQLVAEMPARARRCSGRFRPGSSAHPPRPICGKIQPPDRGSILWRECRCPPPAARREKARTTACRSPNWILIEANLFAELLGIERPALDVGVEVRGREDGISAALSCCCTESCM